MTPWGEKPGGFSGMGGYGGDNAWLGNAKRQSLFRANPGAISWAGKPNIPGMDAPLPATASLSNQPAGQPTQAAPRPASLFKPVTDAFGRTPEQARSQVAEFERQEWEIDQYRKKQGLPAINRGFNPHLHGVDHPYNPAFKGFS